MVRSVALAKPSVALVTGAGRGIGRAVAVALSSRGLPVGLTARSGDELARTAAACPGETLVVPADITRPEAVDGVFAAVETSLGTIDVLVANAGAGTSAPVHKTTDEQWQQMLEVNLNCNLWSQKVYGRSAVLAGLTQEQLIETILCESLARHGLIDREALA